MRQRPTAQDLERYYQESEAGQFRAEYFGHEPAGARARHIIRSRADWIDQIVSRAFPQSPSIAFADVGTVYPSLFAEVGSLKLFDHIATLGTPDYVTQHLATKVIRQPLPAVRQFDVITAFEQLEHQFSPHRFLKDIHDSIAPGGLLFLTTRTVTGFDLQVLWDRTPYIFVPEHLNLLSLDGLEQLLKRSSFDLQEISTPGQLDVELVRDAVQRDPTIQLPSFLHYLIEHRSDDAHEDFQAFLQKHRLSSHVRLVARRLD